MIRVLMIFGAPVLAMFYFAGFVDTFGGDVYKRQCLTCTQPSCKYGVCKKYKNGGVEHAL